MYNYYIEQMKYVYYIEQKYYIYDEAASFHQSSTNTLPPLKRRVFITNVSKCS